MRSRVATSNETLRKFKREGESHPMCSRVATSNETLGKFKKEGEGLIHCVAA